jgi:hypothetical protein
MPYGLLRRTVVDSRGPGNPSEKRKADPVARARYVPDKGVTTRCSTATHGQLEVAADLQRAGQRGVTSQFPS